MDRHTFKVAIAGPYHSGKTSLLRALMPKEVANLWRPQDTNFVLELKTNKPLIVVLELYDVNGIGSNFDGLILFHEDTSDELESTLLRVKPNIKIVHVWNRTDLRSVRDKYLESAGLHRSYIYQISVKKNNFKHCIEDLVQQLTGQPNLTVYV
jgi:tRNA U34 5-carboxymethylaminomethyl modifying GTPase MnmE/TrmE